MPTQPHNLTKQTLLEFIWELSQENAKLKAENERLKEVNQSLSMLGTDLASTNENVRKEFFRADKNKDMWRERAEKYHKTLQEIKAIAENYIKGCVDCSLIAEPYECEDCTDGGMAKLGKKILDLITKAEEE